MDEEWQMVTVAETGESREPSVTFWIKVATSRVLRLQGGGEAKLRRQLRFLVASFWRLASQVGGLVSKLPSASVKSLSIIGRNGGSVVPLLFSRVTNVPPYFNGKGESPFHSRSSTTTFRPTWSRTKTENCVDRRRKRTNPLVLIGTIEERKRMVAPFAQGTSSENNVGDRVRTLRWLRPCCVGSSIFRYGDRSR